MKMEAQEVTTAVDAAKLLTGALPTEGKVEVLEHLITQLNTADLSRLSGDARRALLQVLPEPTQRPELQVAYEGNFTKLEVRPGIHGNREVQFTLRGGLGNLEAACTEINEAMKGASNYPKGGFKVYLSGNNDLPSGQDVTVTYTPVIKDSGGRVRFGTDSARSHQGLLSSLGLEFVNNDLHRLACGALRVKEGFPKDRNQIGSSSDKGDLNEGMVVRTERGSRSGAVSSYPDGVSADDWFGDFAGDGLVVAGAAPRN